MTTHTCGYCDEPIEEMLAFYHKPTETYLHFSLERVKYWEREGELEKLLRGRKLPSDLPDRNCQIQYAINTLPGSVFASEFDIVVLNKTK